jgi:ferric-dicitrate binding protein FerR (iron transport regulator)
MLYVKRLKVVTTQRRIRANGKKLNVERGAQGLFAGVGHGHVIDVVGQGVHQLQDPDTFFDSIVVLYPVHAHAMEKLIITSYILILTAGLTAKC